ncbi:10443_t:CDS:2 [Acaulospora morrowiae]|uniref:10443_t:CDS:1 n=1 Tax=Acaulospora morrowiae TaxID=94023 RepID=A0A9N8WQD8_9GLOM|nr:10443_t:CDS:2 [Acaulospora morrowiae]
MAIPREPQPLNLVQWLVRTAVFCVFYGKSLELRTRLAYSPTYFAALLFWPFQNNLFHNLIVHTQRCYGTLLVSINQYFAPSNFIITVDETAKGVVKQTWNGAKIELDIPERIILIANHQGMRFFQFIFLKRRWAADKGALVKVMNSLASSKDPLWLLIFPEGTVVCEATRKSSKNFAEKIGTVDHEHLLLPRSTGLNYCTQTLRKSVSHIYDLTIGLEGISAGQYPEDIYTLRKIYFEAKYPRNIHIHIRRYAISKIPDDEDKFAEWLRQRWVEKDALMSEFYTKGKFPTSESSKVVPLKMNSVFELYVLQHM